MSTYSIIGFLLQKIHWHKKRINFLERKFGEKNRKSNKTILDIRAKV